MNVIPFVPLLRPLEAILSKQERERESVCLCLIFSIHSLLLSPNMFSGHIREHCSHRVHGAIGHTNGHLTVQSSQMLRILLPVLTKESLGVRANRNRLLASYAEVHCMQLTGVQRASHRQHLAGNSSQERS